MPTRKNPNGKNPTRTSKKDATRRALLTAAQRRFAQNGFDATTLDELCADAGVSRRTFFRYFADKEALVFPYRAERLNRFLWLLEGTTAASDGSPLGGLRKIAQLFAKEYAQNREQLLAQQRLIGSVPALIAREREIDQDWEQGMARVFNQRLQGEGGADSELRARVLAGAAIGVIRATLRIWFEREGRLDLGTLGAIVLDALERGFFRR